MIYDLSPTETPFVSSIGRDRARNILHQWNVDELADPVANAQKDGDDHSGQSLTSVTKVGNYCQISTKYLTISGRADVVDKPGRDSETAYQVAKKMLELRRDLEHNALLRQLGRVGTSAQSGRTAGVPAWIRSNVSLAPNQTAPDAATATGPGSLGTVANDGQALDESDFLSVVEQCYTEHDAPQLIMMGPKLKQAFSGYIYTSASARVATPYQDFTKNPGMGAVVQGAVEVYVTDFGQIRVVPNRFIPNQTINSKVTQHVFLLNPKYWCLSYLRGFKRIKIAKTGDSTKRMLLADWCLTSKNEKASGIIGAVDTAAAMVA